MGLIDKGIRKAFNMPEQKTSVSDALAAAKSAPDLLRQAAELREQTAAMQAASMQAMTPETPPVDTSGPDFEPVTGVSLELYAEISKALGANAANPSEAAQAAGAKGISPENWEQASKEWAARIQRNRAVGQQFNNYYIG